jgi:hypothetical protein
MRFTMPVWRPGAGVRALVVAAAALGGLLAAAPLFAQEVKPGPEHALFREWEGTWEATVKTPAGESKGTQTMSVGLNGLWLLERFTGDIAGGKFEGVGGTSYDPAKKKYVSVWIDSMSTRPMVSEGTYDAATKTLTMAGDMPMPDGATMKVTMISVTRDANTRHFTLKGTGPDGKEIEMLQITYRRRVK